MGTLYIVATPIGNLEDITLRALRVLKEVAVIACEDTRTTRVLLSRYEITTKTISYHAHSSENKHSKIIELLEGGQDVALVSDAGTPGISDPGSLLVAQIRADHPEIQIVPIPGASAITTAFSASGVMGNEFTFLGFLPHKKGRETLFREIAEAKRPSIFYESSHRILKTLASLEEHCVNKKILIGRELTKTFEEFISGSPTEVLEIVKSDPRHEKGEFVVIVSE